jgi:hypothetical protein
VNRNVIIALAVMLVIAIAVRFQLGRATPAAEPPPIVKDSPPPKPKPSAAPTASSSAPKPVDTWIEDTEAFAWPSPPPPKKGEVHVVDPTHIMVDRAFLDGMLRDQATLARSARIVPEMVSGVVVGVRIFGVRKGTFFDLIGLRNGDRVDTLNGQSLADPQQALESYTHLRKAERVFLTLTRAGAPLTIHYLLTTAP